MCRRLQRHVVGERSRGVRLRRPEHRGGAGVDQTLHLVLRLAHRLEHRQRAQHVHLRSQERIRPARRHLQAGQMHNMRNGVRAKRVFEIFKIGYISGDVADTLDLLVAHQQAQTFGIFLQIVNPHLVAALQQIAHDPAADATVAASQKNSHGRGPRGKCPNSEDEELIIPMYAATGHQRATCRHRVPHQRGSRSLPLQTLLPR